jgi:hypothetical protein
MLSTISSNLHFAAVGGKKRVLISPTADNKSIVSHQLVDFSGDLIRAPFGLSKVFENSTSSMRNLEVVPTDEITEAIESLNTQCRVWLHKNSLELFGAELSQDEIDARFSPPIKTTERGTLLRLKVANAGRILRITSRDGSAVATEESCIEELDHGVSLEMNAVITISPIWFIEDKWGYSLTAQTLMFRPSAKPEYAFTF